jgi:hypothetical protein
MFSSATRVVALMFAVTLCTALIIMAVHDHAHDVSWPFAIIACTALLAVPIDGLLRALHTYLDSGPGRRLLAQMIEKVVPGAAVAATVESTMTATTTTTPLTHGGEK